MSMDIDVSRWILEFLLRKPIPDRVVNEALSCLPLSDTNSRLKKTILLRSIDSKITDAWVSEKILDALETIEELDRSDGVAVTESMKAAYCAVAVECTVKYLWGGMRKQSKYLDAVERIWRGRIRRLERAKSDLVSEELKTCFDEIEAVIWDANVRKRVLNVNTRNDACRLVSVYLGEAMALMGNSFLEYATRMIKEQKNQGLDRVPDNVGNGDATSAKPCPMEVEGLGDEQDCGEGEVEHIVARPNVSPNLRFIDNLKLSSQVMKQLEEERLSDDQVYDKDGAMTVTVPNVNQDLAPCDTPAELHKENVLPRPKHVACHRRNRGRVKITDSEEMNEDTSRSKYDVLPSSEVTKVQEALKSSSLELQAVVKDPLPDALRVAKTIVAEMERNINGEPLAENRNKMPNPTVENSFETSQANEASVEHGKDLDVPILPNNGSGETVQSNEANLGDPSCNHRNNVPRPSLMERNSTAQVYEWDDTMDDVPEDTTNRISRPLLPSPKRKTFSPLRKDGVFKFAGRRRMRKWSLLEEDTLRTAVQKYGIGNWKHILESNNEIFEERTVVDLKDKWRNMTRYRHH